MKLEDIPKKEIFTVPDDYFDKLPGNIQARISVQKSERSFFAIPMVRYALPVLIVGIAAWFWLTPTSTAALTAEEMVAQVATEDLLAYINETDVTTDELVNSLQLDQNDADAIQQSVYELDLSDESIETILDEIDLNSL